MIELSKENYLKEINNLLTCKPNIVSINAKKVKLLNVKKLKCVFNGKRNKRFVKNRNYFSIKSSGVFFETLHSGGINIVSDKTQHQGTASVMYAVAENLHKSRNQKRYSKECRN